MGGSIYGNSTVLIDLEVDGDTLTIDATNDRVGINTASPSTTLDVTGAATISGVLDLNDTTDSSSKTTGAVKVAGGVGIEKKLFVGTDLAVDGTSNLDDTDIDGTLVVDGTNISLDSTSTLNIDNSNTSNGITIGTATSGVPVSIGHTTSETTVNDNLTVTGDLTVNGTTTTINSTTLTVDDKVVVIASGAGDSAAADGAGISVDGASATFLYDHTGTQWEMNKPLEVTGNIATTGDIIIDDGGSLKEAGGTAAFTFDGSGHVTKIGQDSPSSGQFLKYDGAKWVADAVTGNVAGSVAADDISAGDAAINLTTTAGNITIDAQGNDTDIIFKGTDSNADTTFLTIDGSAAGAATFNDKIIATELDISGDADIDGTLEADAITVNGTALNTVIAGVTVTNATNATNSTNATNATNAVHVSVADNESTDENNLITFIEDASATGNVGLESDGDFHYNPSSGTVTATIFKGNIDAVDGDFDGTLEADAITVGGVALAEVIQDTVGAMVASNTETGIAVTYEDGDGTLDFVLAAVGTSAISDDAVTVAKIEDLARGNIIYGNASAETAKLSPGSNGQVLTSDGTDISWADASGGGATLDANLIFHTQVFGR
jgi:cytoskeletal protein CcmA (bactofilin family)